MPMIDVYAAVGTFGDKPALVKELAAAMMRWEAVPPLSLFTENTAAFVHELPADAFGDATGSSDHVRVDVLTPKGILDRTKMLGVVEEMTGIVAAASGDPNMAARTWVLVSESADGGWGIGGHAYTVPEIAAAARALLEKAPATS
jgi:phenylpyruvate tautomerase PptA (4-oxalocrotonate tautomerase family)